MNFLLVYLCRFAVRAPSSLFSSFSRQLELINFITLFHSPSALPLPTDVLHYLPWLRFSRTLPFARFHYLPVSLHHLNVCRWYWNIYQLVIIYAFGLDLVPDLPWADEPSPGNLRLSTEWFLATLSLLMPAFSLVYSPPPLPLWLLPVYIAPLPIHVRVFPNFGVRF